MLPAFCFSEGDIQIGKNIENFEFTKFHGDLEVISLVYNGAAKNEEPFCLLDFTAHKVQKKKLVEDLSLMFNVPQKNIFHLLVTDKLNWIVKHLDRDEHIIVYFNYTNQIERTLNKVLNENYITQIDYGFSFFAVLPIFYQKDMSFYQTEISKAINGKKCHVNCFTLVYPENKYNVPNCFELSKVIKDYINNEAVVTPYRFRLNENLKLTTHRNYNDLWRDLSSCQLLAGKLEKKIRQLPSDTKMPNKICTTDFEIIKEKIIKSAVWPLREYQTTMKYYSNIRETCIFYCNKDFNSFSTVVDGLKDLLIAAVKSSESFSKKPYSADINVLASSRKGTKFLIISEAVSSLIEYACAKAGFEFIMPHTTLKDGMFYVTGDEIPFKDYGYVISSQTRQKLSPSPSLQIFSYICPCKKITTENFCICMSCESFFFYHLTDLNYISCNCSSINIKDISVKSSHHPCSISSYKNLYQKKIPKSDVQFPGYNILIMGQSGTGKSTLINALANYLKFDELCDAEKSLSFDGLQVIIPCQFDVQDDNLNTYTVIVGDKKNLNENFNYLQHCVTQMPQEYTFKSDKIGTVRIIDTPGLADARGIQQDNINLELIRKAVVEVHSLHALCFVLKPNESKLTVGLETTMRSLLSIFPKEALRRICFCFTNSRGTGYSVGDSIQPIKRFLSNFQEEYATTIPFEMGNVFCMDNEGFLYLCAKYRNIEYTTTTISSFQHGWKKSLDSTIQLISRIKTNVPIDTTLLIFYKELSNVVTEWAKWFETIPSHQITGKRIRRFGKVSLYIHQNLINTKSKYFINLSKSKGFDDLDSPSFKDILSYLYEEFIDSSTNYEIKKLIKNLISLYTNL
uniref:AIG1-type G domain-containing protein n=1 Tax=Panagrolaimus sp. PS1159 TaxID=55785 RepID=A0AC35FUQ1_9BILA